jgi:hypothetical protein
MGSPSGWWLVVGGWWLEKADLLIADRIFHAAGSLALWRCSATTKSCLDCELLLG